MPERVNLEADAIPEKAERALEHIRPTHAKVFAELHGFAAAAGVEAEVPASTGEYDELHRRLQEAGFRYEVRKRYGSGFEEVWRAYRAQFNEWEREYRASDWHQPPLLVPLPTVLTRQKRRRLLTRPNWTPYWPLKYAGAADPADPDAKWPGARPHTEGTSTG